MVGLDQIYVLNPLSLTYNALGIWELFGVAHNNPLTIKCMPLFHRRS